MKEYIITKISWLIIFIGLIVVTILGRMNNVDMNGFEMLIGFTLAGLLMNEESR